MEKSDDNKNIPVHDLTSLYATSLTSPHSPKPAGARNLEAEKGNSASKNDKLTLSPSRSIDEGDLIDNDDHKDDDVVHLRRAIVDSYGDKGEYEGGVLRTSMKDLGNEEPQPHALGTMQYADGRIYKGQWKDGQWHGHGRTTYPNGDSYEGKYEGDQRHGIGVYKWNDGRVFQGNFRNDQRNGHGVYRWPDGSTYVGNFQEGQRHGQGTYTFHDGSIYKGEWRRGVRHGTGEYNWVDGRTYKGQWVAGKAHGYGTEIRSDGSIRHDGKWENDRPI